MRPRLIIADDHAMVAEGLERIMTEVGDVVARVGDGAQLVEVAQRLAPDIIVERRHDARAQRHRRDASTQGTRFEGEVHLPDHPHGSPTRCRSDSLRRIGLSAQARRRRRTARCDQERARRTGTYLTPLVTRSGHRKPVEHRCRRRTEADRATAGGASPDRAGEAPEGNCRRARHLRQDGRRPQISADANLEHREHGRSRALRHQAPHRSQ